MVQDRAPKLVPLRYEHPYCERCRGDLKPGDRVAWGKTDMRFAVHCEACHQARLRTARSRR